MGTRRGRGPRCRLNSVSAPTPVQAVVIEASVKELLAELLHTMQNGMSQRHSLGDATVTARFVRAHGRRQRGWVLYVQQRNGAESDEIEVGFPLTKQDVGWIDQRDGWFVIVGTKVSIVAKLLKALGIEPHRKLVTRVG